MTSGNPDRQGRAPEDSTAEQRTKRVEKRLALPVLASALVSVPAVFLSTMGGVAALIGTVLNWISLSVLLGESLILLWVSQDLLVWIRRYRAHLLIASATVPAVIFAVGPVQILRLLLSLGAFQIFRAGRILRAGRIIRGKVGLRGRRGTWLLTGMGVLAAVFVVIILSDPNSRSREVIAWFINRYGLMTSLFLLLVVLALTAMGSLIIHRRRNRTQTNESGPTSNLRPQNQERDKANVKASNNVSGGTIQSRLGQRRNPDRS